MSCFRYLTALFLIGVTISCQNQKYALEDMLKHEYRNESDEMPLFIQNLAKEVDFILAYTTKEERFTNWKHYIVVKKDTKDYKAFIWIESQGKENKGFFIPQDSATHTIIDSTISYLSRMGFWSLSQSNLDINTYTDSSGTTIRTEVVPSHAILSKFRFLKDDVYGQYSDYELERLQQRLPSKDREDYLSCKEAFLRLFQTSH